MSLKIIIFIIAHALPPIVGAALGKTKVAVWTGAAIAFMLAAFVGNANYVVMDLIGVGLGTWIGLMMLDKEPEQ